MLCFPAFGKTAQPNILLILADDLGYADLGIQGCRQFKTPNIDSIAKNGVRCRQGYVSNSVCAPSRAGMLSGRIGIGFESNLPHNSLHGLDVEVETMADVLKSAGYKTFCIGKWHLGYLPQFHPNQRGFDEFYGLLGGSRSYFALKKTDQHTAIERNGQVEPDPPGSYLTDRLTDGAIDYIESHAKQNPDQPFFMYLSYTAPHGPMHAKPGAAEKFTKIKNKKRQIYAAMVTALDEGVGKVLQTLEKNGLTQNTLVVFMSDNGGPTDHNASSNKPLKGKKGTLWEGGVRVPFMMQWPAKIPARQELDEPVVSLDLLPTFGSAAGIRHPLKTDGINLMPLFSGAGKGTAARDFYWRRGDKRSCALRAGRFKWVESRGTSEQWLFDLEADMGEKNNLLGQFPEVAEKMEKKYSQWEASIPDPAFRSDWKAKKGKK